MFIREMPDSSLTPVSGVPMRHSPGETVPGNRVARKQLRGVRATLMFEISSAICRVLIWTKRHGFTLIELFGRDHCYCISLRPSCCQGWHAPSKRPRNAVCQNNLRQQGVGLAIYSRANESGFYPYIRRQLLFGANKVWMQTVRSVRWRPAGHRIMPDSIIFLNLRASSTGSIRMSGLHSWSKVLPYGNELCLWPLWLQQRRPGSSQQGVKQILLYWALLGCGVDVNGRALPDPEMSKLAAWVLPLSRSQCPETIAKRIADGFHDLLGAVLQGVPILGASRAPNIVESPIAIVCDGFQDTGFGEREGPCQFRHLGVQGRAFPLTSTPSPSPEYNKICVDALLAAASRLCCNHRRQRHSSFP